MNASNLSPIFERVPPSTLNAPTPFELAPPHEPNLTFEVRDFGPIAEANGVEFKPLTVLIGPSNTGKTYAAMLLHAFARAVASDFQRQLLPVSSIIIGHVSQDLDRLHSLTLEFAEQAIRLATDDQSVISDSLTSLNPDLFSPDFRKFVDTLSQQWTTGFTEFFSESIKDIFAVSDLNYLTRTIATSKNDSLQIEIADQEMKLQTSLPNSKANDRSKIFPLLIQRDTLTTMLGSDLEYIRNNSENFFYALISALSAGLRSNINSASTSYYVPAGRTGIMTSRQLFNSQILRNLPSFGLEQQVIPTYPGIARDFLNFMTFPEGPIDRTNSPFGKPYSNMLLLADILESAVLKGQIRIEKRDIGMPNIKYMSYPDDTPILRASSMVSEIAPIVLLLRYRVEPGDLMIIDEPEAHLHPAAQQQFAAVLALMVRCGVRVLITTHSHYLVEQLGNFVAVADLNRTSARRALAFDGALEYRDVYLEEDEVAVYDFQLVDTIQSSIVKQVPFDSRNYGYFSKDHNWAIADQMNRTQRVIEARIDAE